MPDGSVWTGHYNGWDKMSDRDKQTGMDTRAQNWSKGGKDKRQASEVSTHNIIVLKNKLDDLQRSLAAVKSTSQGESNNTNTPDDNVGDSFGG